jgi:hypothetical protein
MNLLLQAQYQNIANIGGIYLLIPPTSEAFSAKTHVDNPHSKQCVYVHVHVVNTVYFCSSVVM